MNGGEGEAALGMQLASGRAPTVDVIIATACREERGVTMDRALASLRAQAGVRVRPLIIVNGRSYHQPLFERLRADPRLQVHYIESGGFPMALSVGRTRVSAEFYAFLDDDDELLPDTLALRVAPMLRDPAIDVVAANGVRCARGREAMALDRLPRDTAEARELYLRDSWLASCGGLYRTSTVGGEFFDGRTAYFEWTMVALRLLLAHKRLAFLDIPVFRKYEGDDSVSWSPAYHRAYASFVEGLQSLPLPDDLRRRVERKLAPSFNSRSLLHFNAGELREAWRWHLKTLCAPRGWRHVPYTRRLALRTAARALRPEARAASRATGAPREPRVTVGMPVYNSEPHIAAAIESVLAQTFRDFQLIISDNASTDRSAAICAAYAARDSRVRLLRNPVNLGGNPNYRKVAEAACGEYFKWAASNDLIAPDYLERCIALLDARPDVVLAFGSTVLFEDEPEKGSPYDDRMDLQDDDPVVRFRKSFEGMRLNNVLNGVMRLGALRRSACLPDYMGSDNVLIAELALAGKIVQVPLTRFFRRLSRDSATQLQSHAEVRRHHYPTDRAGGFFQSWQFAAGCVRAVLTARLPIGARLHAAAYVARRIYWQLPQLGEDLREAWRFYVLRVRT
jgi:glycosyltransferase involved in cell wall biosynthesis